jgi:hypothetical protein
MNEELRQLRIENKLLREDARSVDAVDTLTEEGWVWDGDQWQRPPAAQTCPTCVSLARTVMLDQTSHDAQRRPLRGDQIAQILDCERMKWNKSPPTYEFDLAFARAIEAAHGIKE